MTEKWIKIVPCTLPLVTALLTSGCGGRACGEYSALFKDPRIEKISGGIVIGRQGAILLYDGDKLKGVKSGTSEDLLAIDYLPDDKVAVVVGRVGTIRSSDDNGATWSSPAVPPGFAADLFAVGFGCGDLGPAQPGMTVGEGGAVLRSSDRGLSWDQAATPASVTLRTVAVINQKEAVTAGDGGVIYRTLDFGETWQPAPSPTTDDIIVLTSGAYNCVNPPGSLEAPDHVLGATRPGDLLVSRNRGETWEVFDHFPEGPVTDAFLGVFLEQGEEFEASIVSRASYWSKEPDGWLQLFELPVDITGYDSYTEAVVGDGAIWAGNEGSNCL